MTKPYQLCGLGNAIVDIFVEVSDADFASLGFERGTAFLSRQLQFGSEMQRVLDFASLQVHEILHRAKLSPLALTSRLSEEEGMRLYEATRATLTEWTERLRREVGSGFPEKVTAFRDGMAVHGRFRKPCPDCGAPVQRIVYAEHETNYCARCQTGGRLLADRALSRLLRSDWPRTLEELERMTITIVRPRGLTPLAFPLWAEHLRAISASTEKWEDRVRRMAAKLDAEARAEEGGLVAAPA